MEIKKWLFSNMFLRNMISDIFGRSAPNTKSAAFIPYFQYWIAPYQPDYYLYFPKEPYASRYKNEIFNKLNEYRDADIAEYLEFHYLVYPDKDGFLRFLKYELYGRLQQKTTQERSRKLQFAQGWVSEKLQELQAAHQASLKQEIEKDLREALPAGTPTNLESVSHVVSTLTQKLTRHFDQLMVTTEERIQSLTDSFVQVISN